MTQRELADLVWSLVRQMPEAYREIRERLALQDGDATRLLAETRREIREATAVSDGRDRWSRGVAVPDYSRLLGRFDRLLDLGMADELVAMGTDFFERSLSQIELSEEGEGSSEIAECMTVRFSSRGAIQPLRAGTSDVPDRD